MTEFMHPTGAASLFSPERVEQLLQFDALAV
jgi:hypothetical protein